MMDFLKQLKFKKFYLRIYSLFSSVIIIVVTLLLWIVYANAKQGMYDIEYRESVYYLDQVRKNINYIDESVKRTCVTIFFDNDTQGLLNFIGEDTYTQMRQINIIEDTFVSTSPYIHSIYLYNRGKDSYYSTYKSVYHMDADFLSYINHTQIYNLQSYVRKINNETVITYMLSDDLHSSLDSNRIYVNIRGSWFFKNIGSINNADNLSTRIFIYDDNNNLINRDMDNMDEEVRNIDNQLKQYIHGQENDTIKPVILNVQGESYIGTITYSDQLKWTIVKVQPESLIVSATENLKHTIMLINILVLFIALIITMLLTKNIYKPVKNILETVSEDSSNIDSDEFTYLKAYYKNYKDNMKQLRKEKEDNKTLLKKMYLKKLIANETSHATKHMDMEDQDMNVDIKQLLSLMVCTVDNMGPLTEAFNYRKDNELIVFVIENILFEIFDKVSPIEIVYMGNYEMVLLANSDGSFRDNIHECLVTFQEQVREILNITISCSVSEDFMGENQIPDQYVITSNNLLYKFLRGNNSIIFPEVIMEHTKKMFIDFNFVEESSFIESLRSYYLDDARQKLRSIMQHIKSLEYQSALLAVVHLQTSIKDVIFEMNLKRQEPIDTHNLMFDFNDISDMTLDDYHHIILDLIDQIHLNLNEKKAKNNLLAESIIKVIEEDYYHDDLGAASIADKLHISTSSLGRVFKEYTGLTIPKYINSYRLNKTIEWMENSNLTISEIILKVGYQNESYFFRIFKQKYGVTPRNYIIGKR